MPRSKRAQVVSLTQTAKKTRDHKSKIVQDIRNTIDNHKSIYLFSFENMRSNKFKNVRMHFRGNTDNPSSSSRIILGKNKILQIALGRTPEEEYSDNLRHVSKLISGSVGLLITSLDRDHVVNYFENQAQEKDFARAGTVSPIEVRITQEMVETHPVSMVEQFRKLGLPVEVQVGKVGFVGGQKEYLVCKEGQTLDVESCKILVHFGIQLSEFKVKLECVWEDGQFEKL